MKNKVIFLSFEAESYMFYDLHNMLKSNYGISSLIVNCDASSFVNNSSKKYYPRGFNNYLTLERVHNELHKLPIKVDFDYIARCEKEYGQPKTLNELLMAHQDINYGCRYPCATPLPTSLIQLRYLELTFRWAEKILNDNMPNLVFTLERNYYIKNLMFQICQRRKIPFKTVIATRIGSWHIISDHFGCGNLGAGDSIISRFREKGNNTDTTASYLIAEQIVADYKSGERLSPYDANAVGIINKRKKLFSYRAIAYNWLSRSQADLRKALKKKKYRGLLHFNWMDNSPLLKIIWRFRNAMNKVKYRLLGERVFSAVDILFDDKTPYVYWALHTLPESSTLTLSDEYDELELIGHLRRKLPVDIAVVVKENPNMLGDRPFSFYKKLKKLPNVVVIDPLVPSNKVVAGALGVAGISGTALLEAAFWGKPCISYGFPEFYPLVTCKGRCETPKFARLCADRAQISDSKKVIEYVAACIELGFELDRKALVRERVGEKFIHSKSALEKSVISCLADLNLVEGNGR